MSDITVAVLLGVLAGAASALAAQRALASRKPKPPSSTGGATSGTSAAEAAELPRLAPKIAEAMDGGSHPRDLNDAPPFREAVQALARPETPLALVVQYATGANQGLSCAALAALRRRPDREEAAAAIQRHLGHFGPWAYNFALEYFTTLAARPPVGASLLAVESHWEDYPLLPGFLRDYFAAREGLGDAADFGDLLGADAGRDVEPAANVLKLVDHPAARTLEKHLAAWRERTPNRTFLESFGRFWTESPAERLIVASRSLEAPLAEAEARITNPPHRSVVVVAERRVGKSAFLRLLGARLAARGWTVFDAGGAELMAGQSYFGQLEERIKRLTEELAVARRIVWYVPDFLQLALSGAHRSQSASIVDQVLPAISAGRLVVISEATPAALAKLLQARPTLRTAVDVVRLPVLSETETHELLAAFVSRLAEYAGLAVDPEVAPAAAALARQHFGTVHLPGAALDLLKNAANQRVANGETHLGRRDLLGTLAQLTGLPLAILDEGERVDLAEMRAFFAARVIGQEEAVGAMADRIAMLKAGLVDPARPIGVFLFAGPTGTGKTELAKALAAFLFGSPERMVRLDMSEFQTRESTTKILGDAAGSAEAVSLVERIRKQPFSVVLLDEFEKAHPNVWDLFLQVFDDGRLTDALGQTADFRHAIIILTSNLGATGHQEPRSGFTSAAGSFSSAQVLRAMGESFRPEFINRLDKVLVFQPLSREVMRAILRKELRAVFERRGLRNREWAVEWEASALDFLLEQGFSPEMGARPLKRAIDDHLLAPLAATIVEHRFPEGDQFLFVRSDGASLQVEFVDPDAGEEVGATAPVAAGRACPGLAAMMLHPAGTSAECETLERELAAVEARLSSGEWESLKGSLTASMAAGDFWNRADRQGTLSRFALMDRVRAAVGTARSLQERLHRGARGGGRFSRELVSRLALQVYLCGRGVEDAFADAPVEVAVAVRPAFQAGGDAQANFAWCRQIASMFDKWARKRHMEVAAVGAGDADAALLVCGFGAWTTLRTEAGLHVLESDDNAARTTRAVARVQVAPVPLALPGSRRGDAGGLAALLEQEPHASHVVRRYRYEPSPLVRDALAGWRTGRLQAVLDGDFDVIARLSET